MTPAPLDSTLLRTWRYTYRVPLLLWHAVVDLPIVLLLMSPLTGGIQVRGMRLEYRLIRWWSWVLMRVFGITVRGVGQSLPGATMFVANHVSWVDIVVLHSQRMMGFVAKREIAGWPLIGWMAARAETIFHQRGSTESLGGVVERLEAIAERVEYMLGLKDIRGAVGSPLAVAESAVRGAVNTVFGWTRR